MLTKRRTTMIDRTTYKYLEIKEYFENFLKENSNHLEEIGDDLHHECFNTNFYITGRYQAEKWLEGHVFSIINIVKYYELEYFGECTTNLAEPEQVVNMYVYIVGEHIVQDYFANYHWRKAREIA
jgi:hypothetical protein